MLLDFEKTKELLTKYDIPFLKSEIVRNKKQLKAVLKKTGFPLFLKTLDLHKTEKRFLFKAENRKQALRAFFNLKRKSAVVLVQKEAKGLELFLGAKRDEAFGIVLMFGLGGVLVEVLEDVSFGVYPLNKKEALEMIKGIKGFELLKGFRGMEEVNTDKLARLLIKLGELVFENSFVKEVDFNPVIGKGSDILVIDPKIIV